MREFVLATAVLLVAQTPSAYDTAKAAAVRTCDAIDANEYQTGLALNPDGYRSYYRRSQCFQKIAEQFRDLTLCDRVRQRRALLSSSWGYSPGNCRTLVGQALSQIARKSTRSGAGIWRHRWCSAISGSSGTATGGTTT
jgi:hypothetical protein